MFKAHSLLCVALALWQNSLVVGDDNLEESVADEYDGGGIPHARRRHLSFCAQECLSFRPPRAALQSLGY